MRRSSVVATLAAILMVVTVGVGYWTLRRARRTASSSHPVAAPSPIPEIVRLAGKAPPVIFVGLDGADWQLFDRYMADGAMPTLARLVGEGTGGVLVSSPPLLSPLVWTTMMTGVSPLEHGILDFTRRNPVDGRDEPITSAERRVPAIWNMAGYGGKRVASLGLWATWPAEPVNGLLVSDRLFSFLHEEDAPPPGVVYPADREGWARTALDGAIAKSDFADVRTYLPWLEEAEYRRLAAASDPYANPVSALRRILIETRVYHDLAASWIGRERPDLAIVYFEGTDSIGHVFAPYAPPRQPSVSEADMDRYGTVPERYFRFIDGLLGEYSRLAQASGAVLMIASDHGFRWSEGRPVGLSSFAHTTAAEWHRPEGVYLLWGPGVAPAPGHPHRGGVEQVCATLLALMGLPPSGDGAPLPGVARSERVAVDYRPYFRPNAATADGGGSRAADAETLEKLRALGYIGAAAPAAGSRGPVASTRTAGSYGNEALILRSEGRVAEATEASEKALALDPSQATALWTLSDQLFTAQRDLDRSDQLLVRAFASGLARGRQYLLARAIEYQRRGQPARGARLLADGASARPDDAEAWLVLGRFRVDQGDCSVALGDFERAARLAPEDPSAHAAVGLARVCLGEDAEARRIFERWQGSLAEAHRVLATGALGRGDLRAAERNATLVSGDLRAELLSAVVLAQVHARRSELPQALAVLDRARTRARDAGAGPIPDLELTRGDLLARIGRAAEAEAAFKEEIRSFPQNAQAYARLAAVYSLEGRPRSEVASVLESMYRASPLRDTAQLAARTLESIGDKEAAAEWGRRAASPAAR